MDPALAAFAGEVVTEADPVRVWDYFFDPVKRMTWETMAVSIQRERNARGRGGNGAMFHCNHGEFESIAEMVDWKPFRYFTQHYSRSTTFTAFPPRRAGGNGTSDRRVFS